jgi:hypothetical protein
MTMDTLPLGLPAKVNQNTGDAELVELAIARGEAHFSSHGALSVETWLIPHLGIAHSAYAAAGCNLLAVLLAGLGVLVSETDSLPRSLPLDPKLWLWGLYLGLFWVGHFWHFGNQDFGVLSLYRLKAGQTGERDRRIDRAFASAMMFVIQPFVYLKALSTSPLSEAFQSWAPVSREFVLAGARIAVVAAVLLTAAVVVQELVKKDRSGPKLLYYLVMLSHPVLIFLLAFKLGFFYLIVYFWSHWFIAVGLVGRINTNYYRERGLGRSASVLRHAASLAPILALAAPIYLLFGQLSVFSGKDYKEVLAAIDPAYSLGVGLLLGFFLAEQLLHYYCDRRLFRFREPGVRRAVAPLL